MTERPRGKKLVRVAGVLLGVLAVVVVGRALLGGAGNPEPVAEAPTVPEIPEDAAERLARAVRHPTISGEVGPLQALHAQLASDFPRVHQAFTREVVGEGALLLTWKGEVPGDPLVLTGHLDVVPVEPGTEDAWEASPFGGEILDGMVWGRGTMDDKGAVVAILQAMELLVADGFVPSRSIVLAFGHDEEVGGEQGAGALSARLKERGISPWLVLDEGGVVTEGMLPGIDGPVALVGISEKGYLSLQLTAAGTGGHSSMPPEQTAVGIVADAVRKVEAAPLPARISDPTHQMFSTLAPHAGFGPRLVLSNLWLFEGLMARVMSGEPTLAAVVRTTTAATIIEGGTADNVLPSQARAVVNFRILPGDTVESVTEHVREVIDDERVEVAVTGNARNASATSPTDGEAYAALSTTIRQVFPGAVVAPMLVVGGTDARYYRPLAENTFRFLPITFGPEDRERLHGTNERLPVEGYRGMVRFYMTLVKNAAG